MEIDVDLHLHGLHSGGVSDKMTIPVIAEQATIKGLDLVGTGDCLHPAWREHISEHTEDLGNGILQTDPSTQIPEDSASNGNRQDSRSTQMMLTTEVEDENRIHHLLLFPSFEAAESVYEEFSSYSNDIDQEGRPRIGAGGEHIAQVCEKYGTLLGPAHAFTPWTAIYKEFDSLEGCYGNMVDYLSFLELGLSADSALADAISDHHDMTLASFSDAHSPWPHRLGREFTRFELNKVSFDELRKGFERRGDRGTTLNAGFDPREGKYHCTACINCYQRYSLDQAHEFDWTCQICGKRIKKGVKDRIQELSDTDVGDSPGFRPEYVHVFPLAEIIQHVVGHASPTTKTVQEMYDTFQDAFHSEIVMLTDTPIGELEEVNANVANAVQAFRNEQIIVLPGGGGNYGELIIPHDEAERERILENRKDGLSCEYRKKQQDLADY